MAKPPVVSIGELIHRVSVVAPTLLPDGDGGVTTTWSTLGLVHAAMESPAQAERAGHGTVSSSATHIVTIRYLANVTTKCQVRFGSRTFGIEGVENVNERNVFLRLSCAERAA